MNERRSGRYGAVELTVPNEKGDGGAASQGEGDYGFVKLLEGIVGYGELSARVISPRVSNHVGDLARGFSPSLPEQGEVIVLGEGEAFYEQGFSMMTFGVKPADGRRNFWLDPEKCFMCHSSVVELFWTPKEAKEMMPLQEAPEDFSMTIVTSPQGFIQVAF